MLNVNKFIPRGQGLAAVLVKRAPGVELDWALRQSGRFQATDSSGRALDVALPAGSALRGGDVLIADDGSLVRVVAAPQPVLVVRPCSAHGSPLDLLRAAHLLGRRGVPIDPRPDHLRITPDATLAALLRQQHLDVHDERAPFDPASDERPGQDHGHGHDHGHDHAGSPALAAKPLRGRPIGVAVTAAAAAQVSANDPAQHVHGPGCGHAHHPPQPQHNAGSSAPASTAHKPA